MCKLSNHPPRHSYIERSNGCQPDGIVAGTNETCVYTPEMRRWDYFKASTAACCVVSAWVQHSFNLLAAQLGAASQQCSLLPHGMAAKP